MNHIQKFLFTFLFVSNISHAVDPHLFLLEAALVLAPTNVQQSPPANLFKGKRRKAKLPKQAKSKYQNVMHRLMQPPRK